MFENVKNVVFEGFCDIKEQEITMQVYALVDIPVDKWNEMARERRKVLKVKDGAVA